MAEGKIQPLIIPSVDPLPFTARQVIQEEDRIIIVQPQEMHGEIRRVVTMANLMQGNLTLCSDGIPIARIYPRNIERRLEREDGFGRMRSIVTRDDIRMECSLDLIDYEQIINHRKTNPTSLDPSGFAW